jgi:hypothetical protein
MQQKKADKRADNRLIDQARRDFKIKKRHKAQVSAQQLTWREHRETSKNQKKKTKKQEYPQSGLGPLYSDAQRQPEMTPPGGPCAWREARRQARQIVSQGAQYVSRAPHHDTPHQQAQAISLYVPPAPHLTRELAFRLDHKTLLDASTLSRTLHGRDGQAQMEGALQGVQGGSTTPPRLQTQDGVGDGMELGDFFEP